MAVHVGRETVVMVLDFCARLESVHAFCTRPCTHLGDPPPITGARPQITTGIKQTTEIMRQPGSCVTIGKPGRYDRGHVAVLLGLVGFRSPRMAAIDDGPTGPKKKNRPTRSGQDLSLLSVRGARRSASALLQGEIARLEADKIGKAGFTPKVPTSSSRK